MGDHIDDVVHGRGGLLFLLSSLLVVFGWLSWSSEAHVAPAMYVFGDSLVDAGNNNHLLLSLSKANFPHHGIDFPSQNPTGRFSNGKNAADFLAEKVGVESPAPYFSLSKRDYDAKMEAGVNFASGGAGILNETTDQIVDQSISLTEQIACFSRVHGELTKHLGSSNAHKLLSKSMFAIVIGGNDLFNYFASSNLNTKITPMQYVNLMAKTLQRQMKRLYNYHARKFVIVGVGAIGCIPEVRVNDRYEKCNKGMNHLAVKYNEALGSVLKYMKSKFKQDMHYSYFDGYSVLQSLITKPAAYGFSEVKEACCGLGHLNADVPCLPISSYCTNRSNHVFWDRTHPTEAVHRIIVDYMVHGSPQFTFPMNVKKLLHV